MRNSVKVFPLLENSTVEPFLNRFDSFLFLNFEMPNNFVIDATRKWKLACCSSWATCSFFVILMSTQSYFFTEPICNIVPFEYGRFYSFACPVAVSGFFFYFMQLSVRIYYAIPGHERIPSIIVWNIILMGFLSILSFVAFNWQGVCIDVLGYVCLNI